MTHFSLKEKIRWFLEKIHLLTLSRFLLEKLGIRKDLFPQSTKQNLVSMLANTPLMKVHELGGEFYIDPRSDNFTRLIVNGFYEPTITEFIRKHVSSDRDVIDVGSNVGFLTCVFSKQCPSRRIIACEPTENAASLLQRNIEHNKLQNVTLYKGAISDSSGSVKLSYVEGKEEYSSLGTIEHYRVEDDIKKTIEVPTSTIDSLVLQFAIQPGAIKIDVEGAELKVLRGARKTLETYKPLIICEINNSLLKSKEASDYEIYSLLQSFGYSIYTPDLTRKVTAGTRINEIVAIADT